MRLIVGLGNPGSKYEGTRHNVGFEAVLRLAERHSLKIAKKGFSSLWGKGSVDGRDTVLLLPQTFMNLSGQAVREVVDFYKLSPADVAVAHDDLDLSLGRVKWDFEAGAAGHRGVSSMIDHLGNKGFYRVRMGIGRPERKEEVESYVLSPFGKSDRPTVEAMVDETVGLLERWIREE